jgi:hypothetical protein
MSRLGAAAAPWVSHSGIPRRAKRDRWSSRKVAGDLPLDVKLPMETGKSPAETPFRIEIWRAHGPPALMGDRPSI